MAESKITSFTKLNAWQKGHALVLDVYRATESFPNAEKFALTDQLCRAVTSITSNIAEGFNRQTKADKVHFYHMALGSCAEVQNQIIIARDLRYLQEPSFQALATLSIDVHKLLNGLIKSVRGPK